MRRTSLALLVVALLASCGFGCSSSKVADAADAAALTDGARCDLPFIPVDFGGLEEFGMRDFGIADPDAGIVGPDLGTPTVCGDGVLGSPEQCGQPRQGVEDVDAVCLVARSRRDWLERAPADRGA